ncbi:MAG: AsmA family protein [Betaproteobacteria bacterium]
MRSDLRHISATYMRNHRTLTWAGAIFLGLILVTVVVVALFDWNWLREPLARRISHATGRTFAINGDLEVHLSLHPRVVANDVVLGNAAWAREPAMAEIKRLEFRFDVLKLLVGKFSFPEIALSQPRVALEVGKDGTPNWVFDNDKSKSQRPFEFPDIGALTIDEGSATYRDPRINTDFTLEVRTLAGGDTAPAMNLDVSGKGRFRGQPATLHARGGALLSLRDAEHPYPVKASGTLGATKASIDGMLLDPLHLKGEQINFTLEGADLAQLYPLIGVPLPPTPAYKVAGVLDHTGDVWTSRRFKGKVGQSDLAGDFAVDRGRRPQFITANLVSQQLLMQDLGGFIGADRGNRPSSTPPPADKLLPAEPFSLEKLQAADADVTFRGEKIVTEKMPLEKISAHLILKNGVLKLAPLDLTVARGNLVAQIEMDGRKPRIVTRADVTAKGLNLERMFPSSKLAAADTGTMGGRARLTGSGNSIAQMLGTANGEAALIMNGGSVSELMLRLSNLDIANSIVVMLGGDKQVPVRCMVGNFKVVDGDFMVDSLLLDTPKVNITGSGDVNFADETLKLRLVSQSKGFSLASLRGPIAITGTFKTPVVRPEMGGVIARGALAVVLGAVTAGIGTLIPLLEFGQRKDSNCAALMDQAKADAGVKASDMTPRKTKK